MKFFYGKQHIDNQDVEFVKNSLKADKITQGKYVCDFERKLQKKFKSKYCSVVSNGTAALYLSIKSLNLKNNSKVICSPITFFSPVYGVIMNNLIPDFSDIELDTYNIDLNKLENKLKKDKKIKAVIAVDYAGHPCNWKDLNYLKKKYNIFLINDNCHAIGAKFGNDIGYAAKFSDLVTHSYHPVKNITTGEGGAVLTNNHELFCKINLMRNHGIKRDKLLLKKHGSWYYDVDDYGFNFRLTDIQSALGISQLKKIDKFLIRRKKIASIYFKSLSDISYLKLPFTNKNATHAYHLYPVMIDFNQLKITKKNFFNKMSKNGIFLQTHYIPVYKLSFMKKYSFLPKDFPCAENFYSKEVSLPIYYSLTKENVNYIIKKIKQVCENV